MKEKLEVIGESLNIAAITFRKYEAHHAAKPDAEKAERNAEKALIMEDTTAILDSLIAELESAELVERVGIAIAKTDDTRDASDDWDVRVPGFTVLDFYKPCAKAAINAIKGITATRDGE